MIKKKGLLVSAAFLTAVLAFTGCSGDDDESPSILPSTSGTVGVNFDAASDILKQSGDVTLSKSGGTQTATLKAASGYDTYRWILDDNQELGTDSELTLQAASFETGAHKLVLFVTQDSVPYSSPAVTVTVQN
jgi:hypothetical protein